MPILDTILFKPFTLYLPELYRLIRTKTKTGSLRCKSQKMKENRNWKTNAQTNSGHDFINSEYSNIVTDWMCYFLIKVMLGLTFSRSASYLITIHNPGYTFSRAEGLSIARTNTVLLLYRIYSVNIFVVLYGKVISQIGLCE